MRAKSTGWDLGLDPSPPAPECTPYLWDLPLMRDNEQSAQGMGRPAKRGSRQIGEAEVKHWFAAQDVLGDICLLGSPH